MSTFLSCAYRKKGRWAFNADGVVEESPSTSVEESMAYFNSNGLDVWYMTTFLDAQVQARFLSLLLATGKLSEEDKKALVLIMKAAQIPDSIYCESSLSQQSGFKRLAEGALGRNGGYDAAKDMVTVKGTMDVKELVPFLANSSNGPSTFSSGQIDDSATPLAVKKKKSRLQELKRERLK
ncbi:hypothetical protein F2Q70_00027944 [Brassica cretica]|uniref:Uncharacterized protein n=1 Tax=Brassica cretica TaxID=69181 RepID=A0A8S9L3A3_BRACR|nr:hypothetical protein F2Q70_00027944 [Brassica cretica]